MEKKYTINDDCSQITNYKYRFINEYNELKEKYDKLSNLILEYHQGTLTNAGMYSFDLLELQLEAMKMYLMILKQRAIREGINLSNE